MLRSASNTVFYAIATEMQTCAIRKSKSIESEFASLHFSMLHSKPVVPAMNRLILHRWDRLTSGFKWSVLS